ncbi:regulator of chromosome condensation 1/beta-lactamase-inhibitor protein II [Pisolithus orientalis]|uniref:regulator of chromosome condensation 1/beta-lactamase-inhibitor protein II n=1 Tax=Pisolithus orientalis TaxID=936130 RepID=UPI002224D2F1|nr:regulator of chromosome condensation 1/beta-lactamase-inhibitor protein II [Pisolithus orientalis]KAI6035059.1 regulator of chromosome condensation 1/beta-lactamase-inhibitor protein II [Pisolithus orientalis]
MSNPPLRRSTRAGSAKPEGAPVARAAPLPAVNGKHTAAKPTKPSRRTASQPTKRPGSPTSSPPKKRARSAAPQSDTEDTKKSSLRKTSSGRRLARKPTANGLPAVAEEPQQLKPYFNPYTVTPGAQTASSPTFFWHGSGLSRRVFIPEEKYMGRSKNHWPGGHCSGRLAYPFHRSEGSAIVWSCGVNDDAALGRITKDVSDPQNPGSFMDVDTLTAIPHPIQSLLDENFRAVQVTAGDSISAAVSADGELRVWGSFRAAEGSLGFSSAARHEFFPRKILELSHKPGDTEKVVSVAAGNNHLVVLTTHGNVFTWGTGEHGQLGRKIIDRRKIHGTVPEKITLGNRSNRAVVIGAGNYCSFAVDEIGDVWGWGLNTMGQTGTGVSELRSTSDEIHTPRKVHSLCKSTLDEEVVQIAGGEHHTLFLTSSGRVFACGRCDGGQLGLAEGNSTYNSRPNPDFVAEPLEIVFDDSSDPITSIASGTHNNMAITRAGVLYAWGQESQGELGVKEVEAKTPTVVVRREGSFEAVAVACGGQHSLGLFRKKA